MSWRRLPVWLVLAGALLLPAACNLVTGADDLVLVRKVPRPGDGSAGQGGEPASSSSGTGGSSSGSSGTGGTGGEIPQDPLPVDGVHITEVAIYQGVKRPLMAGGNPASSSVPIVAGRAALLRVFYQNDGSYNGVPVTARLTLQGGSQHELTASPLGMSTEQSLGSSINFQLPAEQLSPAVTGYRVDLLHPPASTSGQNAGATYPVGGGFQPLPVQSAGAQVRVVLVPIAYGADGSNRLPDTSQNQLNLYRDTLFELYPAPAIELTVRQAVQWNSTVSPNGYGWDTLLQAVINLRQSDGAAYDEYYYGIFAPASSFSAYCAGGCVAGLSVLAESPTDAWARAGIGVGFGGVISAETAAHEIGHEHGRGHAPCGVNQGLDYSFPYSNGGIGSWGYNLLTGQLVSPSGMADFMSYCSPTWISDYNFGQLFNRIRLVNGAQISVPAELYDRTYERLALSPDGSSSWLEPLVLHLPPLGQQIDLTVELEDGTLAQLTGHFYPYSHLGGGVLLFLAPHRRAVGARFEVKPGSLQQIRR